MNFFCGYLLLQLNFIYLTHQWLLLRSSNNVKHDPVSDVFLFHFLNFFRVSFFFVSLVWYSTVLESIYSIVVPLIMIGMTSSTKNMFGCVIKEVESRSIISGLAPV